MRSESRVQFETNTKLIEANCKQAWMKLSLVSMDSKDQVQFESKHSWMRPSLVSIYSKDQVQFEIIKLVEANCVSFTSETK
jgi:azurin